MGRELDRPVRLAEGRQGDREANRLMREIGFTSKVFTPQLDRRPALGRRAPGRRHRPRHLQAGRPDHPRRADHGAVADRDRQGLPLRAPGAGERPLDPVHRPQHPSRLRHRRPLRRARPRQGRARRPTEREVKSAEQLINFMEELAHPGGCRAARRQRHGARRPMSNIRRIRQPAACARQRSRPGASGSTRPTTSLRRFVLDNRAALGTLGVFVVMMAIFIDRQSRRCSRPGTSTARC